MTFGVELMETERFRPLVAAQSAFVSVYLGADVTVHGKETMSSESIDGGGYPVHKPVTAGWNGYGDVQHSAEEAVRMNVRAVADRLTELMDPADAQAVFVCCRRK